MIKVVIYLHNVGGFPQIPQLIKILLKVVLNTKNPNLFLIYLHEMQYLMMYKHLQIDMNTPIRLLIPDTPPSMREKLIQLKSKDLGLCRLDLHMTKYTQSLILCSCSFTVSSGVHLYFNRFVLSKPVDHKKRSKFCDVIYTKIIIVIVLLTNICWFREMNLLIKSELIRYAL